MICIQNTEEKYFEIYNQNYHYFILVINFHFQGGIGDAVSEVICDKRGFVLKKMCVREVPRSGPPMVLLEKYGIGTNCIMKGVEEMMHL